MKKNSKSNKNNKKEVYLGSLCRLENYHDKFNTIFLSDVFAIKKGNSYVNYFNEEEIFDVEFDLVDKAIFFNITECVQLAEKEVFNKILYDKNYCKDRIALIEENFNSSSFKVTKGDYERMKEVYKQDRLCEQRYNSKTKIKQKIK